MRRLWYAALASVAALVAFPAAASGAPSVSPATSGPPAPRSTIGGEIASIVFPLILVAIIVGYGSLQRKRRLEADGRRGMPTPADLRAHGPFGGLGNFGGMRLREYVIDEERRLKEEIAPKPEPSDPRILPGDEPPRSSPAGMP